MKSRSWMWTTVVSLFAALAMPVWTAAQNSPSPANKYKHRTAFYRSQVKFPLKSAPVGERRSAESHSPQSFSSDDSKMTAE